MLKKLITISITAIASLQAATTYNKSLSDGNDDLNYWSDTTSSNLTNHTLVGATEVFTIGSRENIPNVPTTSIKVSTNKLCSDDRRNQVSCSKSDSLEPRYTDDGLATSGEANLRTWYKATTPKSVNGVVDDPCPSLSNVGSVVNWAANFPSLRCERTAVTYTDKINENVLNTSCAYARKVGGLNSADSIMWHSNGRCFAYDSTHCTNGIEGELAIHYCQSYLGDLYISIKVCPDASWTDNGTNCRKNIPEYKLFSTF